MLDAWQESSMFHARPPPDSRGGKPESRLRSRRSRRFYQVNAQRHPVLPKKMTRCGDQP
jgi:hypothetical protein